MKRKYDIAGSSDPEPDERKSKIARLSPRMNGINLGKKTLPADLELFLFSFLCADDFLALYLTSRDGAATVRDNLGQLKTLRLDWNETENFVERCLPPLLLLPRFCRSLVRVEEDFVNSLLDNCREYLGDRLFGWQCDLISANSQTLTYYNVFSECNSPTVLAALSLCPRLQTLDLSKEEDSAAGVEALVQRTLAQCPDIQTVWLCDQRRITDLVLGSGKHLRALHDVTLEDEKQARLLFSEAHWGLEKLEFYLSAAAASVVAQSMPKLAALKELSIIKPYSGRIEQFANAAWVLPALEELHLYGECSPVPEIRAPQLRSAHMYNGDAALFERILVHSRELRDLQVSVQPSAAGDNSNHHGLTRALEQKLWTKLERLRLDFTVPAESLLHFGHLTSLVQVTLAVPDNLPVVFLRRFLEQLPSSVRWVTLHEGPAAPGPFTLPSGFPRPAELKQLQDLKLPRADAALFTDLSFPVLRTLVVSGGELAELPTILATAPALAELRLSNCTSQGFPRDGPSPAAAQCRLVSITIAACAWFDLDQLVALLRLCGRDLETLSVTACPNIGSEALAMIAALGCPALASLTLLENPLMTPASVAATVLLQLIRRCPALTVLHPPALEPGTRAAVISKLPHMGRADLRVFENGGMWIVPPVAAGP